jgi:FXSXX-COOH protein
VTTTSASIDKMVDVLEQFSEAPLGEIADDHIDSVVRRILDPETDRETLEVAAFNSSI